MNLLERVKYLGTLFNDDFTYCINKNNNIEDLECLKNDENTIFVNLSDLYYKVIEKDNQNIEEDLQLAISFLLNIGYKVIIAASRNNEEYCEQFISKFENNNISYVNEDESLSMLKKSLFSINFNQVYDILCIALDKPFISITENKHQIIVLDNLELDTLIISYDNFDAGKILRKVKYIKNNFESIKTTINKIFNREKIVNNELDQYKKQVKYNINNLINSNQFEEAKSLLEQYECLIKNDIEIISIKAIIAFYENRLDDSEKLIEYGLQIDENNFDLLYNLACVYEKKYMLEKALIYFNKAKNFCDEEMKKDIDNIIENINNKSSKNLQYIKRKKVLVVAYIFPPLGGSGVQRTLKFVKYLRDYGWEPVVICAGKSLHQQIDESLLQEIPSNIEVKRIDDFTTITLNGQMINEIVNLYNEMIDDKEIVNEYIEELRKNNEDFNKFRELLFVPGYSVIWTKLVMDNIEQIINISDIDMIYTTSGPYTDHFVGYYLKKKYNKPWVADFRDEWTNRSYSEEQKGTINYKLAHSIENSLVHFADKVVTTSPMSSENYIRIYKLNEDKIKTITNGFDEEDFKDICIYNRKNQKFTIMYNGVLYGDETIKTFLVAIKNLVEENSIDIGKFEICFTRTEHIDSIIESAKNLEIINNIKILGYLEHKESLIRCNEADMLLVVIEPNEKNKPAYPGKIFEYIRLNKPVLSIAPKGSVVEKLVHELKIGLNSENTNIKEIERSFLKIYRAWENDFEFNGLTNIQIEKYERRTLTKDLSNTFEEIIINRSMNEKNLKSMELDVYRIVEESKDDQTITVMNFINYIEENLPVSKWIVDGVHVWPLIRISFSYTATQALCDIPKNKLNNYEKTYKNNFKSDNSWIEKNSEAIFLIRTNQARILLNDKWYDRFCDPLLELCEENNISTLPLEYCDREEYRVPTYRSTVHIQNHINDFINKKVDAECIKYNLNGFDDLVYLISVFHKISGYRVRYFSVEQLIYSIRKIRIYSEYFKMVFNKVKPKVGFVVCYYNSFYEYGFLIACREYGIPSVDIQHGRNGELHFAYGKWQIVPQKGYELIPSIFWSWNDDDVQTIKKWNKECMQWHNAIKGGNPWVNKCLKDNSQFLLEENKKVLDAVSKHKDSLNILYTHTHPGEIPKLLLDAIDNCPTEWRWWIRFHPLASKEVINRDINLLKCCKNKNIEYKLASEITLNAWLKYVDVHVTGSSSSVIEATDFGVATVLIGSEQLCKKTYYKELEKGYAAMANSSESLISSICSQVLKTKEMKKLIMYNNIKVQDIIKKLLEIRRGNPEISLSNIDIKLNKNIDETNEHFTNNIESSYQVVSKNEQNKCKVLSFCIPTYNRANFVVNCVKNILKYKGQDIEVVVCDNNSTDNTKDMLSEIKDKRFFYYRNDKNLGFAINMIKSLEYANGKFLFSLSDEDKVNIDVIPKLINIINSNEDKSLILGTLLNEGSTYMRYEDKIFKKGSDCILNIAFTHSYISGIIFNKKFIEFKELYIDSYEKFDVYPHIYLLSLLCTKGDVLCMSDVFCYMGHDKKDKSNIEKFNNKTFIHPDNRFEQFRKEIKLAESIIDDNKVKIITFLRIFNQYLYSATTGYKSAINSNFCCYHYEISENAVFDVKYEIDKFYRKSLSYFQSFISNKNFLDVLKQNMLQTVDNLKNSENE